MRKVHFTGLALDDLAARLDSRTRALAALRWLHAHPGQPPATLLPARVHDVAQAAWTALRQDVDMPAWRVLTRHVSTDGTIKYAVDLDGAAVETVLIPAARRSTVCVSSQAGCTRSCSFCATARLRFGRNLTAGEIVLQFLLARADAPAGAPARNVVFMGMGEPMDNLDEVLGALRVLTGAPAPALAAGHITVSTSGVLPGMRRFLAESTAHLAISLNATTDDQRARLMPQTRQWPIADLLGELREDGRRTPARRHFIEYVLFDGLNDTDDDARRLVTLLGGINAHVNLIPHNPFVGSELAPPPPARVRGFQRLVQGAGVRCLIRTPRGREIAAACGQLALRVAAPLLALFVLLFTTQTADAAKKKQPPPPPCADVAACRRDCDADKPPAGSCTRLGAMLEAGVGGAADKDPDAAAAAHEKGCAAREARSCVRLAHRLYQGSDEDVARARELLTGACTAGDGRACFNLSEVLVDAEEDSAAAVAEKRARTLLAAECKKKNASSCATLSRLRRGGYGGAKKDVALADKLHARAMALLDAACAAGDVLACAELADETSR